MDFFKKEDNTRKLSYDLTKIEIGESVLSEFNGTYYLCTKLDENNWDVFRYACGEVLLFRNYNDDDVLTYIYPHNRIYGEMQTTTIYDYFKDIRDCQQRISNFKLNIDNDNLWKF